MKITLLGDSIRLIGYGALVQNALGDEFEVFQPLDNCRFSKYTLWGVFNWKKQMEGSRIVHWNNGLWDINNLFGDGCFTSKEEYLENMLRIAHLLTEQYDRVIFATTTPVNPQNPDYSNADIKEYNELIVPHLQKMGIIINDLYGLVYPHIEQYICDDKLHLSEIGSRACSEQVVKVIRETAAILL